MCTEKSLSGCSLDKMAFNLALFCYMVTEECLISDTYTVICRIFSYKNNNSWWNAFNTKFISLLVALYSTEKVEQFKLNLVYK